MRHIIFVPLIIFLFYQCDTSNEPTTPVTQRDKGILILEDRGTQDSLAGILTDMGFQVDMGGPYWEYSAENIETYKLIIFLNGVEWVEVMSDTTQTLIRNFVQNGGTLLSTEWISWSGATNQIINDILPVVYGGSWSTGSEMYYPDMSHTISAGLPDSFWVSNNWSFSVTQLKPTVENQAETVITGSRSAAVLATGVFGNGTVIHWNMGGHYAGTDIWSPEVRLLLHNTIQFGLDRVR